MTTNTFQDADKEWDECALESIFEKPSAVYTNKTQFNTIPEDRPSEKLV